MKINLDWINITIKYLHKNVFKRKQEVVNIVMYFNRIESQRGEEQEKEGEKQRDRV